MSNSKTSSKPSNNSSNNAKTFLTGASTMAATLAAVFMLTAAKQPANNATFDEITVGRINIVEPDGTKRIIISNKAQFPGAFLQGKESPRPDRTTFAGLMFVNEEGTENGGLIQKGSIGSNGKVKSGLSLTFDRFRQDQALRLMNIDTDTHQMTGLEINDVPHFKVTSLADHDKHVEEAKKLPEAEQEKYWEKLAGEGRVINNRVYLGNTGDKGSALQLKDAKGRVRMMLQVSSAGKAEIQMLDENEKVVKTITPTN